MFDLRLMPVVLCPQCRAEDPVALRPWGVFLLAGVCAAALGLAALGFGALAGAAIVVGGIAAGIVNGRAMRWRCLACGNRWR